MLSNFTHFHRALRATTSLAPLTAAAFRRAAHTGPGLTSLADHDPELHSLITHEKARQRGCLELIASENFTSRAVCEALGSCLTNKYAEGLPGARYYGGGEFVDQVENLTRDRALAAYRLAPEEWAVNVQPYSGSPANLAVYTALLKPQDRVMGLDLPSGGHLTHGFWTVTKDGSIKPISATSVYFQSQPYVVDPATGEVDYDDLRAKAAEFKPQLLICGGSAYPREWNYKAFREIADEVGAYLLCDMAHISGLVATQEADSPFEYADVVTTTTHKSLRGPRSGMIFTKKDERDLAPAMDFAVFPALQGGPHMHQIGALAAQLKEVQTPEFKTYIQQVKSNSSALADELTKLGYTISTGGTDNHLFLWDLRPQGLTGSKMERACELASITLNKNTVVGDRSAITPGGVRIGMPAMTTRGVVEADCVTIAGFLDRACKIGLKVQESAGKKLATWGPAIETDSEIAVLRKEVNEFCQPLFMPGVDP